MTIVFHPEPSTLLSYAAGAIGEPFAVVVASHLEVCPACRRELRAMNALGGAVMRECAETSLGDDEIERMMRRLAAETETPRTHPLPPRPEGTGALPEAIARLIGGGIEAVRWRAVGPGVEMFRHPFRGGQGLRFLRAAPGVGIPNHGHVGSELTLVVEGWLRDGDKVFAAGDVCEHDDSVWHAPTADGDAPCICVIAEEGPPRFARG